ncbi:chromatin structure-remodeling complex protein BSH-like [Lotus japonicus]|uniref:chromatin structure-remodeling complex protein BSH-like n=1 Tax=Lotus japonicus TaxID=34305 RepID=UPI0025891ED2|nr:chromatin structure-remodeling complex protein BSH-like [Lotus japonicus]
MYAGEKIIPIKVSSLSYSNAVNLCCFLLPAVNHMLVKDQFLWDLNNFESDLEELARIFCKDMGIEDPEVGSLKQREFCLTFLRKSRRKVLKLLQYQVSTRSLLKCLKFM